ncbi:Acyl-CoA synthetase family member 2, mitochondrial [Amphibalanus amphitrite]|uniref:Medium-chain acyl-CoA ligase ACSF2, mitochondrial n=1 Tax=Amphibalanus amphitrite TaxID=1232801 RepID=A0A6A4V289_AMPAM|nr:medium-chain acyl-CoA ligase ACSF2, mitochondrial-like [Amphibalanus amphitrite]KAF0287239.1 Acyl-CoA synthetase family member 2, mitochondrial [Amphibalanus amphitrite]
MLAGRAVGRLCRHLLGQPSLVTRRAQYSLRSERVPPPTRLTQSVVSCPGGVPLLHLTLADAVDRAAADHGSQTAAVFVHQDIRRSWREITYEADRLARGFLSLGLQKGDRIGIWATNVYEWLLTQYAAAKAGLILVHVNQAYQSRELEYCLRKVGVRTLVAAAGYRTSDYYTMLTELVPALADGEAGVPLTVRSERLPQLRDIVMISPERRRGVLRFDDLLDAGMESLSGELERRQAQVDCDDPCSIQFTSGTTGLPKGATLSHHNVINSANQVAHRIGLEEGSARICLPVALYHAFGNMFGSMLSPLHGNALVFPSQVFDAGASLQATQDERCTHMYGTPTMFVDMVNIAKQKRLDLSSLYSGIVAGAPVPFHLMRSMIEDMNMRDAVVLYGMTEACSMATGYPSDDLEHRCGTVGYPNNHIEVKVVDDTGATLPIGQTGELWVRSFSNFLGYWDDEEKTRSTVTPTGWLRTGDLATMASDGYVKIVGRLKDMVIRGGENIYPTEVEDFLMSHPDVLEAHAFGVPDERLGEELAVWIKAREPGAITEQQIRSFCKGRIAHFKVPRYIRFRDDFPVTVSGKVQKFELRNTFARELGLNK